MSRLQLFTAVELALVLDKQLETLNGTPRPDPIHILNVHDPAARISQSRSVRRFHHTLGSASETCSRIISELSSINDQLKALEREHDYSRVAVYSLPPEILTQIFDWVCATPVRATSHEIVYNIHPLQQRQALTLASVCSQWRQTMQQSHSGLFGRLSLSSEDSFSRLTDLMNTGSRPSHTSSNSKKKFNPRLMDLELFTKEHKISAFQSAPPSLGHQIRSLTVDYPVGYLRFFRQTRYSDSALLSPLLGAEENRDDDDDYAYHHSRPLTVSALLPSLTHMHIISRRHSSLMPSLLSPTSSFSASLPDSIAEDLLQLPSLTSLTLSNCPFPSSWFRTFLTCGGASRLEELRLKGVIMDVEDLKGIFEMCCWTTNHENGSDDGGSGGGKLRVLELEEVACTPTPPPSLRTATVPTVGPRAQAFNNTNNNRNSDDVLLRSTLTTLIIKNCSAHFVRSILSLSTTTSTSPSTSTSSTSTFTSSTSASTSTSTSPFISLKTLSIDLGAPEYSYAEAIDVFSPQELDAVDWEQSFGIDRLFYGRFGRQQQEQGDDFSLIDDDVIGDDEIEWRREEIVREWGTVWVACKEPIERFLSSTKSLEFISLRGPTGFLTHCVDVLGSHQFRLLAADCSSASSHPSAPHSSALISASSSTAYSSSLSNPRSSYQSTAHQKSNSARRSSASKIKIEHLPPHCSKLSNLDIRFPEQHRGFPDSQLEPLRRAICRVLDQDQQGRTDNLDEHFMRVSIPACFPSDWHFGTTSTQRASTVRPTSSSSLLRPLSLLSDPESPFRVRYEPQCTSFDPDSSLEMKKQYVVERMTEECRLHCLLELTLPKFHARACAYNTSL